VVNLSTFGYDSEMRSDGRQPDEMRPARITPNFIPTADGSALIEIGNTRVVATATLEAGVPQFLRGSGKGWVTGEYGMLPASTQMRTPREVTRGKISGRTHEIQRLIGRSLRAVTSLDQLGERTVWVDCDVIQADGGTRTASITAAFVALSLAFDRLVRQQLFKACPLSDYVAAVSAGIVDGEAVLDLNYEEDSRAQVDMNLVMTGGGRLIEVQATAEQRPFDDQQLQRLLALGRAGIAKLLELQKSIAPLKR
jgi:ribonuclease PH